MNLLPLIASAFACEPIDVPALMTRVDAAIDAANPGEGVVLLETAWARIPEACEPPPRNALALVAQRAAKLTSALGQEDIATGWLESACRVAPKAEMPASLGATLAERGKAACSKVEALPTGTLRAESDIRVDGVPLDAGGELTLPVGQHVLAWREGDTWRGRWQNIEDGVIVGLPSGSPVVAPPQTVVATPPRRTLGAPAALVGGGALLAGAGGLVLQMLFANTWNTSCVGYDYSDGFEACEDGEGVSLAPGYYGGIGLIAGGAALGATGLGLGVGVVLTPQSAGASVTVPF